MVKAGCNLAYLFLLDTGKTPRYAVGPRSLCVDLWHRIGPAPHKFMEAKLLTVLDSKMDFERAAANYDDL